MTDRRKCFTFVWKIKNFNFSFNSLWSFDSPIFILHSLYRTRWNIVLYTNSTTYKNCVVCYLERQRYDFGPDQLELDYELSFIATDGSVIQSQSFLRKAYKKGHVDWTSALLANREEVFVHKKKMFMPDDTFTVRCRMWKSQGLILESARCSVETRIDVECRSFFGVIEKFTSIEPSSKSKVCFKSSSEEILLSAMNLCVDDNGELTLQIKPVDYEPKVMYEFRVFILDVFKSKVKSASKKLYDTNSCCIPFTFSKEHLIENKGLYLPNDVLTLQCEIFFSYI
ncbi:hypothetical protein AVEN_163017-1 [Araneus ventricosus]|uniref:MATH domain-containing protein n=1 Tax=Araneus ventricosus TaxID=182803 RepID=A0A4Y2C0A8_ARAVE|nr:hypothetical protein AVEN_163017-1 [Araneus ventricosus]